MGTMSKPSVSIRVGFSPSASGLSITAAPSSFAFLKRQVKVKPISASSPSPAAAGPITRATNSDLLTLLGPAQQASTIDDRKAQQLRSCFRELVPFSQDAGPLNGQSLNRRPFNSNSMTEFSLEEKNELIWWPPAPVMDLARSAVDSGGNPGSIHRLLDPTLITVPDVEGSMAVRCQLTRDTYGRRFANEDLNSYLGFLFELIRERGPTVGFNVSLDRFDLFHGHAFITTDTNRLGILFHAKEHPEFDPVLFPYNMGHCQIGSNLRYDGDSMNLRNILWLAPLPSNVAREWLAPGALVVLDAHPGGIIYRDFVPRDVNTARTIYEAGFGTFVLDVNYLNIGGQVPDYKIFLC